VILARGDFNCNARLLCFLMLVLFPGPDPPELVEDLFSDAKDLIRELTYGCNEKSSTNSDSLAGVDDRIINKILASPFSLLDSPGSEPFV